MVTGIVDFDSVNFVRSGRHILNDITWQVSADQRWVILGPNGAGKSTMLSMMATMQYPSSGTVTLLGEQLGKTNVFDLRPRIGLASTVSSRFFPPTETVFDLVMTAAYAVSGRWNEEYEEWDEQQASSTLAQWGLTELESKPYGQLSDGERKRAQIARAVMTDPEMLLLDEPSANLDLGAREQMLARLGEFANNPVSPAMVLVTHHVEEIPAGVTHALLLKDGAKFAAGPIEEVVNSENLSSLYGLNLRVERAGHRYFAFSA